MNYSYSKYSFYQVILKEPKRHNNFFYLSFHGNNENDNGLNEQLLEFQTTASGYLHNNPLIMLS